MKRYILAIAVTVLSAGLACAQTVSWEVSSKQVDGNLFKIVIKGEVTEGLHIYDTDDYAYGATPTEIVVSGEKIELVEALKIVSDVKKEYDDILGFDLGTMDGKVEFERTIRLLERPADVKVSIHWQACSEDGCNRAEDKEFEITVGGEGTHLAGVLTGIIVVLLALGISVMIGKKKRK